MTAGKPLGFEAHPAIRLAAAIFLEVVLAAVGLSEPGHPGKALLDALEQMEKCFTIMRQIQLGPQPHVDVEILTECRVRMRHTILPASPTGGPYNIPLLVDRLPSPIKCSRILL